MELNNNWVDLQIVRGPIRGVDRSRVGLIYRIKARPDVEDFMRNLSSERKMLVEAISDAWVNANPSAGQALEYYDVDLNNSRSYAINGIGAAPLIQEVEQQRRLVERQLPKEDLANISFLRLVGISNPDGVVVGFTGAYSSDYVQKLKIQLPAAIEQFLRDYLVPITINLHTVSRS